MPSSYAVEKTALILLVTRSEKNFTVVDRKSVV